MGRPQTPLSAELVSEIDTQLRLLFRRSRALGVRLATQAAPDLDPAVFGVLMAIGRDGLTQASDVAEYFGIGKAAVSRQLAIVVRLGLVERRIDEQDGRAHRLALTPDGVRLVHEATTNLHRSLRTVFAAWSRDEAAQFITCLSRFNDAAK